MSPSVLRISGKAIDRNGVSTIPRALVSTCEIEGCTNSAPFGDNSSGRLLTWCAAHNPDPRVIAQRSKDAA